ncbi:hypothetical protein BaRGS_00000676 [Batillaria attramentaria]|uniref:Uncharacterized protein n=1 Tax=Batillaria attramentaria TaxID=370345 RepID=A0ABD0M8J0_9CAEN
MWQHSGTSCLTALLHNGRTRRRCWVMAMEPLWAGADFFKVQWAGFVCGPQSLCSASFTCHSNPPTRLLFQFPAVHPSPGRPAQLEVRNVMSLRPQPLWASVLALMYPSSVSH